MILSSYKSIPAYSNGTDQWTETDCDPNNTLPPYGAYGEQFQCTEFVKRFYSQALGVAGASLWIGDAIDYSSLSWATPNALTFFANSGHNSPEPDDILTFAGPGGEGHVAIVTSVSDPSGASPTVTFVEQNWSITGTSSLPYTKTCTAAGCSFFVSNRHSIGLNGAIKAVFTVQGWLRSTALVTVNPTPTISLLQASSLLVGSTAQTMTIKGTGFLPTSTVMFGNAQHPTVFINAVQLTISLSTADLAVAGTFPVVVVNPGPGGGPSAPANFVVNNPVPSISGLLPSSLAVGSPSEPLSINGANFVTSSSVTFNGAALFSTYVNPNRLTISLSATDLASVGSFPVVVTNPGPGGGASGTAIFSVASNPTANEWTWISGSNTEGAPGVYGSLGSPAVSNVPGGRSDASSWTDSSGNLWLFGGSGITNDLWEFSPLTSEWAWMAGSNIGNQTGVYGTLGVSAAGNAPGARLDASSWTDSFGSLWLFGGSGYDGNGNQGYLNDIWKFKTSINQWTWMGGSNTINQLGVYGTLGTHAPGNTPGSRTNATCWVDSSGHLWLFGGTGNSANGQGLFNDLWEFNPSANEWTWMGGSNTTNQPGVYGTLGTPALGNTPGARFEANGWNDSSGNLWLFGGIGYAASGGSFFLNDLWEFNPSKSEWTWMGGSNTTNQPGVYGTLGTPAPGNTPGSRFGAATWTDSNGNLWLFGGSGISQQQGYPNDIWKFSPSIGEWTWMGGSNTTSEPGVYGILGTPAARNIPGSRTKTSSWTDSSGNFWLFGGQGLDSNGSSGSLNDLWRYHP